jgi:hypothetical protein
MSFSKVSLQSELSIALSNILTALKIKMSSRGSKSSISGIC